MPNNNEAQKLIDALRQVEQASSEFVTIMGVESVKHFQDSFREGGFTDRSLEKWEPRKDNEDAGRATLVKSGDLRRSIKYNKIDNESVEITSDVEYSAIHNYGLEANAWGRRKFMMPKRQFVGDSEKLIERLLSILKRKIEQIFK